MVTIRSEQAADIEAIHRVHATAFPSAVEARLVDRLREHGRLCVSLVAEAEVGVVGHVAFSPVSVEGRPELVRGVGLAPVAVLPEHQGHGVGSQLVRAGLEACVQAGYDFVVLLGAPAYYGRFGFRPASQWGLGNEYGVDEHFMLVELRERAVPIAEGLVRYAPEFAELAG